MATQQTAASELKVGQEFKDISAGSNTKGMEYTCSWISDMGYVYAYLNSDREADDPVEFAPDELVEIFVKG